MTPWMGSALLSGGEFKIMARIYTSILLAVILIGSAGADDTLVNSEKDFIIRHPAVAGQFYPGNATELTYEIKQDLDQAVNLPEIDGQIMALIVPHAGIVYSGHIAAYAYKLLENSGINKVILCGGAHRFGFEGVSVYGPGIAWQTPLGLVHCDDILCQKLIDFSNQILELEKAHRDEHSLEVQLPYLQTVLGNFELVPALIGYQRGSTIDILSKALTDLQIDNHTIMIASTDWQHYLPASEGWKYDSLGIACLENFDINLLEKYLSEEKVKMCGGGAVVAVLKAAKAKGADKIKILKYGDSGDVSGDKSSVVSYVAAVAYKSKDNNLPQKAILSDDEKNDLLKIARQTIETFLKTRQVPQFEISSRLKEPGAAFVTLEKQGQLRGCIGLTEAVRPLYETVSYCAVQAAVADPRFPAVTTGELDDLHIEISVLTPLQKVSSLDEIKVGRDGLVIERGHYRGLLLPQVATDYGWNREKFLQNTCRKAGLPLNAYKDSNATIYKFQAVIFGKE